MNWNNNYSHSWMNDSNYSNSFLKYSNILLGIKN